MSAGIYEGVPVVDLDYAEDSNAETDMNVVMNDAGAFIEVQGTAEGHAFRREELDSMLALAELPESTFIPIEHDHLCFFFQEAYCRSLPYSTRPSSDQGTFIP